MRLLITRPEPDNERTAAALRARGHEVLLAPLLRIAAVSDAELGAGPWAAVLLTSANGARAISAHPRRSELTKLPVLAVGRSSAEAARAIGFTDIVSSDGDGRDLARLAAVRLAGSRLPVLYLAGEERARDLASDLAAHGLSVQTVVVYRAERAAAFPPPVRAAIEQGRVDGVLHFSRRTAETYVACAAALHERALVPIHFCLSEGVAEPLKRAGAKQIRIAPHPDEASLLALVTPQPP
jgi:uroporphyrinogen-III synthase